QKDLLVTDEPAFHDREAGVDPAACSTLLQFRALGPVGDPQPQPDLSRRSVRDPDPDQTIIGVIGTDLEPEDSTIVQRCPYGRGRVLQQSDPALPHAGGKGLPRGEGARQIGGTAGDVEPRCTDPALGARAEADPLLFQRGYALVERVGVEERPTVRPR